VPDILRILGYCLTRDDETAYETAWAYIFETLPFKGEKTFDSFVEAKFRGWAKSASPPGLAHVAHWMKGWIFQHHKLRPLHHALQQHYQANAQATAQELLSYFENYFRKILHSGFEEYVKEIGPGPRPPPPPSRTPVDLTGFREAVRKILDEEMNPENSIPLVLGGRLFYDCIGLSREQLRWLSDTCKLDESSILAKLDTIYRESARAGSRSPFSSAFIAEMMGEIEPNAVEQRKSRALHVLREKLADQGFTSPWRA